ncbi:MAG: multicopper oxidase domain-containing protein [Nitrospirota bacterium]
MESKVKLFGFLTLLMFGMIFSPAFAADEKEKPEWQKKLEQQELIEATAEGRPQTIQKMNTFHEKIMEQFSAESHDEHQHETKAEARPVGTFSAMSGPGHQLDMFSGMMQQGVLLGPTGNNEESVTSGGRCPKNAPVKEFDIAAINVEITLNRWMDYYPGYMYVLAENLEGVRQEEKTNAAAREKEYDGGAATVGSQGDLITPLVIRANSGDCVIMTLRNQTTDGESVGIHIHGSSMLIKKTGKPAVAANADSAVAPGKNQVFEWYVSPSAQEGGLTFHSHGHRLQTGLGLVGTFVVEPVGATYLDANTGAPIKSGWQAMIVGSNDQPDFREYTIMYHEIGDEAFRPLSKNGEMLPQRDPITDVYRPGARALNYRSEPFGTNNLAEQKKRFHFEDESQAYGSYTFGDPATPMPRGYLGDPSKFRLVHGGSDIFHSHHPHGGTIRWPRDPKAESSFFAGGKGGPVKFPRMRGKSEQVDVQVIGPQQVFDLEPDCGAGLCQHLAADFLFHCHVAHHYVAGMWSFWRVYNTLQTEGFQQDIMKPLAELPDRKGKMLVSVDNTALIGKTVNWFGKKWEITLKETDFSANPAKVSITDWVTAMLPKQGQPGHVPDEKGQILAYDATVLDWTWTNTPKGPLAMTEKETTQKWPRYSVPDEHMGIKVGPGNARKVAFDPKTGKLAWPHLQPHFGKRPPFARDHGPAPWLEPFHQEEGGVVAKDKVFNPYGEPAGTGNGGEIASGKETIRPARPGEQGPWSLCPRENDNAAQRKFYRIQAVGQLPITLAKGDGKNPPVVDDDGLIFVLMEDYDDVMKNPEKRIPLVYRANVYDCIDVVLTSTWRDNPENAFASKLNIHSHMWQFDNQASDGVIAGFSYEQSVRPFKDELANDAKATHGLPMPMNAKLAKKAKAGKDYIVLTDEKKAEKYHVGTNLAIGMEQVDTFEIRRIKAIDGKEITFTTPLAFNHAADEIVSVEYVRYRYYPDMDLGTTYWHDHAYGAISWQHGAFGSTIIEPPGSTYHDPKTGLLTRSGYVVDVHTNEPHSIDAIGSFREMVLHIQDTLFSTANTVSTGNPPEALEQAAEAGTTLSYPLNKQKNILLTPNEYLNGGTHTTGGAFNMRVAPFNRRLSVNPDPSLVFSSNVHQDPDTPLLTAYLGDPIMIRNLVTAVNESHTVHVTGHWFRYQRYNEESQPRNTIHIGIAERHDLSIPAAGGPQKMAGDYLYYNGRASKMSEGSWGLIRVLDKEVADLKPLRGHEEIPTSATEVCPSSAPVKEFNVVAMDKKLSFTSRSTEAALEVDFGRMLNITNPSGKVFVLADEKSKVAGDYQPMPLTLHVNVGDCIKVNLKNDLAEGRASFHVDNLAFDPLSSQGINVGKNPGDQTIGPGEKKTYTFYAHPQVGENAAFVADFADPIHNQRDGLFGSIVIGPKGSLYRDPVTGVDISLKNSWRADVILDPGVPETKGRSNYRDFSLYFQDEDNILGTSFMPYLQQVAGLTGVNYKSDPFSLRVNEGCESLSAIFSCIGEGKTGDPVTPILETHAGDAVVIHVYGAFSEQNSVFGVEGHEWPEEPFMKGADLVSNLEFGGSETMNVYLNAGGVYSLSADYVYTNHRMAYQEAGQWGFLRVLPLGDKRILPLSESRAGGARRVSF